MFGQSTSFRMKRTWAQKRIEEKSIVLVVDDYRSLARALEKHLGPVVDQVYTAGSAWEAQYILDSVPVSHLLCDLNITVEDDSPLMSALRLPNFDQRGNQLGFELAPQWRKKHSSIKKVVVYTGGDLDGLSKPNGVDALVCKTDIDDVIEALLHSVEVTPSRSKK